MLVIIKDPAPLWRNADPPGYGKESATPYHVQTSRGVTLASFKTRAMAESYRRSKLLQLAMEVEQEFNPDDGKEETLP